MKTALLVIDVVNSCCSAKCESPEVGITFTKIRQMIPKLANFIKEYKQRGGLVIYVNITKWNKKHLAKNIVELYKNPKCRYYSEDTTGFDEQFYKIKPEKNDMIFTKNTYDAFSNTQFNNFLKKKGIKQLIITGVFGDGCVESTIQSGFSKGYNFIILKDLIETTDVKIRQDVQKLLKRYTWPVMFGPTITSKEFLSKWF